MTIRRRNFSNAAAVTTLNGAIGSGDTSLTVASASNYPDAPFTIRIDLEVLLVTAKSGTTFTVERGYDGTVAAAQPNGAQVTHVATAADFRNKWIDPLVVEDTLTAYDDEFDRESTATWLEVTPSGTALWTQHYGVLSSLFYNQTTNHAAGYITSLNGLSYPLYVVTATRSIIPHEDFTMFGPLFAGGTTTAASITWNRTYYDNSNTGRFIFGHQSGTFSAASTSHYTIEVNQPGGWLWQRIDWISTNNYRCWLSPDGVSWASLGQAAQAPSITPTHYGFGVSAQGGGTPGRVASFQFFRVYTVKPTWWQEA